MQEVLNSVPTWLLTIFVVIAIWESVWKALALYRAGTQKQPEWFVVMFIFNTAGLLPILYYFYFSKKHIDTK